MCQAGEFAAGDGLVRPRDEFFVAEARAGFQRLIVLTFYKKETTKVPRWILHMAIEPKMTWERKQSI